MSPILSVKNLSVALAHKEIIHNVNFALPPVGISVMLGRSGSGKTTFLRALNRLNEELAPCHTTGEVIFNNENIYALTTSRLPLLRRQIGMLFQNPNVLPVSIWRNLALPLSVLEKCSDEEKAVRIEKALRDCFLWEEVKDRLHAPAVSLSGGQQQRLCLARALSLHAKILLLDEPTASLDVYAATQVESLLQELGKSLPILMVSHSPKQALALADALYFFHEGRIVHSVSQKQETTLEELEKLFYSTCFRENQQK